MQLLYYTVNWSNAKYRYNSFYFLAEIRPCTYEGPIVLWGISLFEPSQLKKKFFATI